jgi:hypothetical protein
MSNSSPDHLVGSLIAHRFKLERIAGEGGMGVVFAARDQSTDQRVAVKLLHVGTSGGSRSDSSRFFREAQVLSELRHPGIVSYVAHGQTPDGRLYLAMEWLDGEDLGKRLQRGTLSLQETVTLLQTTAEALSAAHSKGIVHRDLKPSNLFLRGNKIESTTLFDFGIAQTDHPTAQATRTGLLIGTPEYMAPEQARGVKGVWTGTDVFALACIAYACLTGRPPFSGDHVAALLTKILFESPPPLRSLFPSAPEVLETLLLSMLSKEATARPADAKALLPLLAKVAERLRTSTGPVRSGGGTPRGLTHAEQQLFCVILGEPQKEEATGEVRNPAGLPTESELLALQASLSAQKIKLERLADGSLFVAVPQATQATDQVREAARVALLLFGRWPALNLVMTTGRGERLGAETHLTGEALDRAGRYLARLQQAGANKEPGILLDSVSAGLLDASFDLRPSSQGPVLWGMREENDEAQLLLGKPSPCLGREQELGVLEALLSGCIEESQSQAVLVLSPSGVGKTRLRREFRRRMKSRDVTLLSATAEPLSSGTPHALLVQMIRRFAGAGNASPKLAELCASATAEAFVSWFAELAKDRPLLVFVDDLQWADAPSLRVLDRALRTLQDTPFLLLGFGRPEVERLFPKLWTSKVQDIRLSRLGKRACERLVIHALGQEVSQEMLARMVTVSQGNAQFLVEMIRAVADGQLDALPETMLAILQARLGQLEPAARRVLRAASVFGNTFWRNGVLCLLGQISGFGLGEDAIERWLQLLTESEMIAPEAESRLPGQQEFAFRSTALREAAYSLLTDEDKQRGHGLAAVFLEEAGLQDSAVLTFHTLCFVKYLEQKRSSLKVARLMMLTGLPLKTMLTATPKDEKVLRRLRAALRTLLREEEDLADFHPLFDDTGT